MLTRVDARTPGIELCNKYSDCVMIKWDELDEVLTAMHNLKQQHTRVEELNKAKEELKTAYHTFFVNPDTGTTCALYAAMEDYQKVFKK